MPRRIEFQEFLSDVQSRIAEPAALPKPQLVLLEQTVEELRVAVEELRLAEERAASSEEQHAVGRARDAAGKRLAGSFSTAPWALVLTDPAGTVRDANPAAATLLGLPLEHLPGKPLAVFIPGDERARFRRLLAGLSHGERLDREPLVLMPRNRLPIEAEASAWCSEGDEPCITWTLRDVTRVRGDEDAQHERAEFLRRTLDSLPVAVAALDLDGSVLLWNQEARRLLGWSEDELNGAPNPALGEDLMPVVDAVRRAGTDPRLTVALTSDAEDSHGGHRRIQITVAPLAGDDGNARGTVAVFRRADQEESVRQAAAESEAARARPEWSAQELRRVLFAGAGSDVAERMRLGIASALDLGFLRPGDRLPGAREAAAASGADHRIVSAAYRRLAAEGLVEVRPRRGAQISQFPESDAPQLPETAEWLSEVLEGAAGQQVRVAALSDLVRRWTANVSVRCLCVDASEDGRAALMHEMSSQWGMECTALGDGRGSTRDLAAGVRAADLVVATHASAGTVRAATRSAGKPLVLAGMNPELVEALERALRQRSVLAVVADTGFGERLRAVPGGERLRVVQVSEAEAVAAAAASGETVLLTLAAQQRLQAQPRLLWAPAHFLAPLDPRTVARVLIRANLAPARAEN